MSDRWMTIAEAAACLKVHPRTIERRIAGGKIQTRRADDGLLQVLINLPDTPDSAPDTAIEAVRELAADQITLATGSASALVRFAQQATERTQQELDLVRHDVRRARRVAVLAWSMVALVGVGVTMAVGWTASTITRAREEVKSAHSDVQLLTQRAEAIERETQRLIAERDALRDKVHLAQVEAALAAGQLAAYKEQSDNRPTTRPASLVQRIAAAIAAE